MDPGIPIELLAADYISWRLDSMDLWFELI
jgi:hypothetical protein